MSSFLSSRLRQRFNSYPGRPQLLKFTSMSLRDEAESKLDKFSAILEAELLNLKALKELSWQGVPRKVIFDNKCFYQTFHNSNNNKNSI